MDLFRSDSSASKIKSLQSISLRTCTQHLQEYKLKAPVRFVNHISQTLASTHKLYSECHRAILMTVWFQPCHPHYIKKDTDRRLVKIKVIDKLFGCCGKTSNAKNKAYLVQKIISDECPHDSNYFGNKLSLQNLHLQLQRLSDRHTTSVCNLYIET